MAGPSVRELRAQFEQIAQSQQQQQQTSGVGKLLSKLGSSWSSRQISRVNTSSNFSTSEPVSALRTQLSAISSKSTALPEVPSDSLIANINNSNLQKSKSTINDIELESSGSARAVRAQFELLAKANSFKDAHDKYTAPAARNIPFLERSTSALGSQGSLSNAGRSGSQIHLKAPLSAGAFDKSSSMERSPLTPAPKTAPPTTFDDNIKSITMRINETLNRIQEKVARSRAASVSVVTPRITDLPAAVTVMQVASPQNKANEKLLINETTSSSVEHVQFPSPEPPKDPKGRHRRSKSLLVTKASDSSLASGFHSVLQGPSSILLDNKVPNDEELEEKLNSDEADNGVERDSENQPIDLDVGLTNTNPVTTDAVFVECVDNTVARNHSLNLDNLTGDAIKVNTTQEQEEPKLSTNESTNEVIQTYSFGSKTDFPEYDVTDIGNQEPEHTAFSGESYARDSLQGHSYEPSGTFDQFDKGLIVSALTTFDRPGSFELSDQDEPTPNVKESVDLHHASSVSSNKFSKPKRQRRRTSSISEAAFLRKASVSEELKSESAIAAVAENVPVALEIQIKNEPKQTILDEAKSGKDNVLQANRPGQFASPLLEQQILDAYTESEANSVSLANFVSVDSKEPVSPKDEHGNGTSLVQAPKSASTSRFSLKNFDQWKNSAAQAVSSAFHKKKNRMGIIGKSPKDSPQNSPISSNEVLSSKPEALNVQIAKVESQAPQTVATDVNFSDKTEELKQIEQDVPQSAKSDNAVAVLLPTKETEKESSEEKPAAPVNFKDRLTSLLAKGPMLPNQSLGGSLVTYEERENTSKLGNYASLRAAVAADDEEDLGFYEVFEESTGNYSLETANPQDNAASAKNRDEPLQASLKDKPETLANENPKPHESNEVAGGNILKKFGDVAFVNQITLGLMKNTASRPKKDTSNKYEPIQNLFAQPNIVEATPAESNLPLEEPPKEQPVIEETQTLASVTKGFQKPRRPGRMNSINKNSAS